jgi:dephospho-CoA kinase
MITVGLTGGLGTGKTTVLGMFSGLGAKVLSADTLVHRELAENSGLKRKIRAYFGAQVFEKGSVNRAHLAKNVFRSASRLKRINALVHPLVKRRILDWLRGFKKKSGSAVAVVEVPLLFETGFENLFDVSLVVVTSAKVQRARLARKAKRGTQDLNRRLRWQLPLAQKIARSDFIIDNNRDKKKTLSQVKDLMKILREGRVNKEEEKWKQKRK